MFRNRMPLALCTVLLRKGFEVATNHKVKAALSGLSIPLTSACVVSGALLCLYRQLNKGVMVSIGQKSRTQNRKGSKNITGRYPKIQKSWLLKKLSGKRRGCTEAVYRIAQTVSDSVSCLHQNHVSSSSPRSYSSSATSIKSKQPVKVIYSKEERDNKLTVDRIEDCGRVLRGSRESCVKRLASSMSDLGLSFKRTKFHLEYRRTRSGKIYNTYSYIN